ncbi:MAG TPA: tetratricopeptide repeat protein [Acidobacteriaceae bacterium]|nr:tetratricopeptide repeat protein [Acidobacteriaceae bacterium]
MNAALPSPGSPAYNHTMDKIAALNEILELDPGNAFARYGLAMEHVTQGKPEAALTEFAMLIEQHPDYVPAYQMSAQTLIKLSRIDEARARLDAGLAAAQRTGNAHAASEMQAMRNELG